MQQEGYQARVAREIDIFKDWADIHELPAIFHYWSNSKIRPLLETFGFNSPQGLFKKYLELQCRRESGRTLRFISIGAGNCDLEIELARHLTAAGDSRFLIDCLELNPAMLERGRAAARASGVEARLNFVEGDFNDWIPQHEYDAVLALQTLHHVVNLEGLFRHVRASLRPHGRFIVSDIIGRNGHLRWPEALAIVQEFWKELPPAYRYNRLLQRHEEEYINWDCSIESFEGIRAQDILPLLLSNFHFELFVAYGNAVDPFLDRPFGHNFDASAAWDRDFVDRVHQRDVEAMRAGEIKPVHMEAVLLKEAQERVLCHAPLTPEFSVRWPEREPDRIRELEMERDRLKKELEQAGANLGASREKLDLAELKLRLASESKWLRLGRSLGLGPGL